MDNDTKKPDTGVPLKRLVSCPAVRDSLAYGGIALAGMGAMACTLGLVLNRPVMTSVGAVIIPLGVVFYATALRELNREIAELKSANDKPSGRSVRLGDGLAAGRKDTMGLKVIRRGEKAPEQTWAGTCTNCNSEVEGKRSGMTKIESCQREPGEWSWEVCPVCGKSPHDESGYGGLLMRPANEQVSGRLAQTNKEETTNG